VLSLTVCSFVVLVCRGTSTAFSHPTNVDALYRQYQDTFSDCTYIDGNVEIVFLTDQTNYDLSFLKVLPINTYRRLD